MLTDTKKREMKELANKSLDEAESIWGEVGEQIQAFSNRRSITNESVDTHIPGFEKVELGQPRVGSFIAIVADMRESTNHLMVAVSDKKSRVSGLQRVFYETSALLPCLAKAIAYEGGSVTEFLGDGVLGLISATESERPAAIYSAHDAAYNCIEVVKQVINPILRSRYSLPDIKVGVGLSYSEAVVTVVGLPGHREAKVFGKCVYYATKLAGGDNEIFVDEALKLLWPTTQNGVLSFRLRSIKGISGYLVGRSSA